MDYKRGERRTTVAALKRTCATERGAAAGAAVVRGVQGVTRFDTRAFKGYAPIRIYSY